MRTANRRLLGLVMLLPLVAAVVAFRGAGRWLRREDSLSRADVILVLAGGMPYAAQEAGKLFQMGYAPEVWVSRPDSPARKLEERGIHFVGEEEYNRQILIHAGVPEASIHILPDTILETEQEVAEAAREMRLTGKIKLIIVTSPQHTRRVKALWKKLPGDNSNVILHAAPKDPFDADHWWRNSRDAFSVVRETLGLVNAVTGLHVRPPHSD